MMYNQALLDRAIEGYRSTYGAAPELVAYAPGRVNLIGEHTDYNQGFSLPCAIPFGTAVAMGRADLAEIRTVALDIGGEEDRFELINPIEPQPHGRWHNHPRGVVAGLMEFGLPLHGANLAITGNVPKGAGLSSSASLGVSTALGLLALAGLNNPDRATLAKVAQWAEHHYVGCACGLMDQLASAFGQAGHALLIDFKKLTNLIVPVPDDLRILIVHSGVERGLVDSAYNERRIQCEAAAKHYGVSTLRDVNETSLVTGRGNLDDAVFRRARHVVTENARTLAMADALRAADYSQIGKLMLASHHSMRDDFDITLPEIDQLVETMGRSIGEVGGVRMTGGGFGGCVVAICPTERIDAVYDCLSTYWRGAERSSPLQTAILPAQGAHIVRA